MIKTFFAVFELLTTINWVIHTLTFLKLFGWIQPYESNTKLKKRRRPQWFEPFFFWSTNMIPSPCQDSSSTCVREPRLKQQTKVDPASDIMHYKTSKKGNREWLERKFRVFLPTWQRWWYSLHVSKLKKGLSGICQIISFIFYMILSPTLPQ